MEFDVDGVRVVAPPEFGGIQAGARSVLGDCRIGNARPALNDHYFFDLEPGMPVQLDSRRYLIAPFPEARNYYFSLQLSSRPGLKATQEFASLSIVVFEGELLQSERAALFRLEWESAGGEDPPIHAQPHWHIYEAAGVPPVSRYFFPDEDTSEFVAIAEESEASFGSPPSRNIPVPRLHFAAAAQWQMDVEYPQYSVPEGADFERWVSRALAYIVSQLLFLDKLRGRS